jgi:hypothetical protein
MEKVPEHHTGKTKQSSHFGQMEMVMVMKNLMLTATMHSGLKTKMILTKSLFNHGLDQVMKVMLNQTLKVIQIIISMLRLITILKTLMEFQELSKLESNHIGQMGMVQVLKNLMLMVTSKKPAQAKLISIRKPDNLGLVQIIKLIRLQFLTWTDLLWVKIKLRISMEFQELSKLESNHTGLMEMVQVLRNLMLMVISPLGAQAKQISIRKPSNHGLVQIIKVMLNQDGTKTLTPWIKKRISMEFQELSKLELNHTGQTEMVQVLKNLMLMVISPHGAQVKQISIRKPNNLGLVQIIKVILLQYPTWTDLLWVKTVLRISMEFQDNSLLVKNHTGEMETVQVQKNLMLMVTLLPTQLLKLFIIKMLDNHGLHLQIKTM